jgi:hypothetical protein
MAVDVHLFASGIPRRMGAAAFTLASTVEQATGAWNHRVTAVYGTEPIPVPTLDTALNYPVPPGPLAVGNPGGGDTDPGVYYPTWSAVAPALPYELTPRPVGGGMYKPLGARAMAAGKTLPSDLVYQPQIRVRTGAAQGRVTTAPKPQMRWVRQGG